MSLAWAQALNPNPIPYNPKVHIPGMGADTKPNHKPQKLKVYIPGMGASTSLKPWVLKPSSVLPSHGCRH